MQARKKSVLPADELHEQLVAAFGRIRPLACKTCTVPRPKLVARSDASVSNWELPFVRDCEFGCANFIRWLTRQYAANFDLDEADEA
ncbi:MAG TPA: hypothetical protein VLS49_08645 [Usitatibacter sp.]|nr:hypothetical protein [Usitatibacter sp.]